MAPRRLVFGPEVDNLKPDRARIKALTGGDLQSWRPLYGQPRFGVPTASLWLLGNKAPTGLGLTDPAMLERVRAVPYPEVPKDQRDSALVEAFDGNSPAARKRRQALAARLVKLAAGLKPGRPPELIPEVFEAVDRLREDDLGAVGVWLRDTIQRGSPDDALTSAGLWEALKRDFGQQESAERVDGLTRAQVVTLARDIHGLPETDRVTTHDGRARGWRGWKLDTGG
ncbi:MAG: hypothetical protein OXG37_11545 [Actinomycetia bacterium]|nr:hypothetical protein [Actinomycetes bacterium]